MNTDQVCKTSTPRPWEHGTEHDQYTGTDEWCERTIVATPTRLVLAHINEDVGGDGRSNAELIIRAVNSFEAMREALKGMLQEAPHPTKNVKKEYHYLVAREAAKRALELAEGKAVQQ